MLKVLQPTELCGLTLKNRLFRSATWMGLCDPDGSLTPDIYQVYRELAQGGIGTIITELTDVCERNNAIGGNMRLYSDALIPDYRKLVSIAHAHDVKIIPQLNMYQYSRSGIAGQIVAVDDLTVDDIKDIEQLYVSAAIRAHRCGFDAVQLHLAYGWLLYRFLSPYCNHRTDVYGGSFKNRARIVVEIIHEIKSELPGFPVCAKFSFYVKPDEDLRSLIHQSTQHTIPFSEYYASEECADICKYLHENGLDFIEVLGDHSPLERGNTFSSCYLELAKTVRAKCDIPIIMTGCNNDADRMSQIIEKDGIEFFGLSRALIREPDLPERWKRGDLSHAKCIHCDGCYQTKAHQCRFK